MDEDAQPQVDIHAPFTKEELIQQLSDIDADIALLLSHTGTAIQSLAQPVTPSPSQPQPPAASSSSSSSPSAQPADDGNGISTLNAEERLATFKSSMNSFLSTLHSVDVRLKRQIWGLEEAGIITLKSGPGGGDTTSASTGAAADGLGGATAAQAAKIKTNLEPDGVGKVGGLDVGWLNARSSKVERDMEAELWTEMRNTLGGVVEGRLGVGGGLFGKGEGWTGDGDGAQKEGEGGEDVSMLG